MSTNRMNRHQPLGPSGTWKTGQRVAVDGNYVDQYGLVSAHYAGTTFPPCIGRKGECAFRTLLAAFRAAI